MVTVTLTARPGCSTGIQYAPRQDGLVYLVALVPSPQSVQAGETLAITGNGFTVHGSRREHGRRAIRERDTAGGGLRIEWRFSSR
jgi:hypothetical protein